MAKRKTTDAVEILKQAFGIDPDTDANMLKIREQHQVAQLIYDARKTAGLSQKQLAELVETDQRVISRLESAEYDGHSLSMLRRIAKALHQDVEIRFVPEGSALLAS